MSALIDAQVDDEYVQFRNDQLDAAKMEPFNPLASQGVPWWQALVSYGAVRAIDNRFGPVNMQGNTQAGSFGGANGKTYANNGSATAGHGFMDQVTSKNGALLLLAGAAVAYFLLVRRG